MECFILNAWIISVNDFVYFYQNTIKDSHTALARDSLFNIKKVLRTWNLRIKAYIEIDKDRG